MLVTYLLLAVFVRKTTEATEELNERIRRAAARATTSNERFLRRVSAELHDGPIQDLGFALLRIDHVMARSEVSDLAGDGAEPGRAQSQGYRPQENDQCHGDLVDIKAALQRALHEIRGISRGLGLPQLTELTVAEIVRRAVRDHERRTGTGVQLDLRAVPDHAPLSVKITLYRLLQEALNNAYRHAGGTGQRVRVANEGGLLCIEVSDQGPGFDTRLIETWDQHLGLAGMRERVESLGGRFQIVSVPEQGTRVIARLPIAEMESRRDR
jgi:signal transduction histidine kinase